MRRIWIESAATAAVAVAAALALGGCATSKDELLPQGPHTLLDVWNQQTGGGESSRQLFDARAPLRRPLTNVQADVQADVHAASSAQESYTRTATHEIASQFHRLPNPDLVLYVFPHLAGGDLVPVPGYSTVFPLYRRVQYAMPGERLEDY